MSVVTQMLGRGCRSFGVAQGIYYTSFMAGMIDFRRVLEG